MTFRAVKILREVDVIAAEDTRHTRKLLTHFDIHTPLVRYDEFSKVQSGEKISVTEGDYRRIRDFFSAESFDLVIANPPYYPVKAGESNKLIGVARARHEFTATLEDVVTAARFVLKYHGSFCMIHSATRLCEIIDAMHRHQFEPKRLQMIYPKKNRDANLVMIDAIVGGNAGSLKILPPLVIHEDDGSYTSDVKEIYGLGD